MSAKLAYEKPKVRLPPIAAEIWLVILRYATAVPDPLQPPLEYCTVKPSVLSMKRHRQSMVTKRFVVRVCRQWYWLAIPFLYEHIVIGRFRTLGSLLGCCAIHLPPAEDGDWRPHSHTKRLDVKIRDVSQENVDYIHDHLRKLLKELPNLTTLIFKCPPLLSDAINQSGRLFIEEAAPNLEYLNWLGDSALGILQTRRWPFFLQTHRNLRVMNPPSIAGNPPANRADPDQLLTPFLHLTDLGDHGTADASFYRSMMSCDPFPTLRRASILCFGSFVTVYGTKLTSLHLQQFSSLNDTVLADMEGIRNACPNLQELYLSLVWNIELKFDPFPKVAIFGVQHMWPQLTRRECQRFFDNVLKAKKLFPDLRQLRFIDERNVVHLQKVYEKALMEAVVALTTAGVAVEDHDGRLIAPSSSQELAAARFWYRVVGQISEKYILTSSPETDAMA